jgi:prepilin-type processing-associated H-X9-DG protein
MNANNSEFYGFHPGGVNYGFGDGSTRFIQENVAINIFAALLTAGAGEVVSTSDY